MLGLWNKEGEDQVQIHIFPQWPLQACLCKVEQSPTADEVCLLVSEHLVKTIKCVYETRSPL